MSTLALSGNVLVLNKFYQATQIVSVRRAFALLAKRYAEVIEVAEGRYQAYSFETWIEASAFKRRFEDGTGADWIRTVSLAILVPRVIRLVSCERVPAARVKFNRRNIFARDENRCQYCGRRYPTTELSLDHVIPRSRDGASTWANVVVACTACNARKGGRTPEEAGMRLIRLPVAPKRSPLVSLKMQAARYASWKTFLDAAYWSVELR